MFFGINSIIQKLGAQLLPGMNEKFGAITFIPAEKWNVYPIPSF